MAENITYPPYDAMLAGSTTNDTWSDGTQFSIGNTTYAWDSTPGLWRAFTTATSSSSGGGGLVLGEFFSQTVTASTTSLTLDHTGPAWVFLTAGSGSGAVRVNTNPDPGDTGRGGNGGSGGFFLQDVSVLEGANVVIGTGGAGRSISRQPNQEQAGLSGTGSSITWSGITLTCTAGAGAGIVTNGADGMATITGTDAPTLLTNAEVTTEAEAYWHDFAVADTDGNLELGSSTVSVPVTTGSPGGYAETTAGETGTARSLAGSAGRLYIVYQNQASGGSSGGSGTTINIGGTGGEGAGIFTVQSDARNGANDPTTIVEVTFTANYTATYNFLLIGGGGRGRGSGASVLHSEPITEGTVVTISVGGGGDDSAVPQSEVGGDSTVSIGGSVIARASGGGSTSTDIGNGVIAPQNPLIPPAISVNATAVEDSWAIFGNSIVGAQGRDQGTGTNNAIGGRIQFVGTV